MGTKQPEFARTEREAWEALVMAMELVAELSEKGGHKDVVQKSSEKMAVAMEAHRSLYEKRIFEEFKEKKQ